MTPFESLLKDDQIADVLTFVRNSWGNKSPAVKPADVSKMRQQTADVKSPYKEADFKK